MNKLLKVIGMSLIVAIAVLSVHLSSAAAINGRQLQKCTISQPGDSCNARLGGGEFITLTYSHR